MRNDAGNEVILGAFSKLRLIAALAKVDATVALAKSILPKESSLVIFTYFVQVAKSIRKKLSEVGWEAELLIGETPAKDRQALVDRFQVCETYVVFDFSYQYHKLYLLMILLMNDDLF